MAAGYEGGKREKRKRRQRTASTGARKLITLSGGTTKYRSVGSHRKPHKLSPKRQAERYKARASERAIKDARYRAGNVAWNRRRHSDILDDGGPT